MPPRPGAAFRPRTPSAGSRILGRLGAYRSCPPAGPHSCGRRGDGPPAVALVAAVLVFAAAGAALRTAAAKVDAHGWAFFNAGQSIVNRLDSLAQVIAKREMASIPRFYSPGFTGELIGLNARARAGEHDGITTLRFVPGGIGVDRAGAVEEWRRYLASFATIGEARFTLDVSTTGARQAKSRRRSGSK